MIIPFTKEDLEYFDYCLGRKPIQKELDLLDKCLVKEKLNRHFAINQNRIQKNFIIKMKGTIYYTTDGKYKYKNDSSILKFSCNGKEPKWIVYSFLFKPPVNLMNKIQETLLRRVKSLNIHKVVFEIPHNAKRKMSGEIEVEAFAENDNIKHIFNSTDQILSVQLPNPKKSLVGEKRMALIINDLMTNGLLKHSYYTDRNIGELVFQFIQNKNTGVTVHENIINDRKNYAILVVPKKYVKKVTSHFSKNNYKVELFGQFNDDPYLHYFQKKSNYVKLPKSIFSLQSSYTSSDLIKDNYKVKPQNIPTIGKRKLAKIYLEFSKYLRKQNNKTIVHTLVKESVTVIASTHILLPFTNDLYLKYIYTILGEQISNGVIIKHMCIDLHFSTICESDEFQTFNNKVTDILSALNIAYTINVRYTDSISKILISCLISHNNNLLLSNTLSSETNYFISVVGVLKGQLINSKVVEWLELKQFKEPKAPIPNVETNIYNTINYCLKENIIKSSIPILNGGLMIALEKLIRHKDNRFGIKVYISRKMKPLELIFGEQFGTFLVVLNEKNLMEFQRICMKNNASSSTIGRMIDTHQIIINDYINVSL